MSSPPRVSVLLANRNGGRFLGDAIASVVQQTFPDWEFVIVDTGSSDESVAVLQEWASRDPRIKPVLVKEAMNCPQALNLGLTHCRGPLIARIESDDLWEPRRLQVQVDFLDRPENARTGVCGSAVTLIDGDGRVLHEKPYPLTHAECLDAIWFRNVFCHSAVLARREVFEQAGGYTDTYLLAEDLELWMRAGRLCELQNVPDALVRYRVWPGSLTNRRLATLAWRSYQIRLRLAPTLGHRVPWAGRAYSTLALGAALLPASWARRAFEFAVGLASRRRRAPGVAAVAKEA